MAERRSLFDRLGGESAIEAAVGLFYDKVLADPLTAPFFARLEMRAQIRKQISFMAKAFGAPEEYQGRDLRTAHRHLVRESGLADVHFDAVAGHLEATLKELGVADDAIAESLAIVGSVRNEVLDR